MIAFAPPAHAADCPDARAALDDAYAALATADVGRAETRLAEVRVAWGCDRLAEPADLARAWLAEGVLATWNGLPDDAAPAFAAARRADRTLAPEAWGDDVRAAWTAAGAPAGTGSLAPLAPLERGERLHVDGVEVEPPATVAAGLHLVQVVRFGVPLWAAPVYVAPDGALAVEVVRPPPGEQPKRWHGGPRAVVGLDVSGGPELEAAVDGEVLRQAGTRLGVPVELGWELASAGFSLWPELVAAPLLTSPYLFAGEEEPARSPLAFGAGFGVAAPTSERVRLGVLGQVLFPGQLRARATAAVAVAPHLDLEARAGLVFATDGAPFPAASFAVAWVGARSGGPR